MTEADEQVAAPVPVHATQVPTDKKYPELHALGTGPVVHAEAPAGHGKHIPPDN